MKLQTKVPIQLQLPKIEYDSKLLMLGSCFSENIGYKFQYYKFRCLINPFGIFFHPIAIEKFLLRTIHQETYNELDLFQNQGLWHCFDAHSKVSHSIKEVVLQGLNTALSQTYEGLKTTTHIILTFGTAWVYKLKTTEKIVANCHKVPQKEFSKQLLTSEELNSTIKHCVKLIKSVNQNIKIILTVSPVRHLKDGFIENTRSKAHLISAVHQCIEDDSEISYFPSYEILNDELRDYRFFKSDMIHPSDLSITYIWERFIESWMSQKSIPMMKSIEEIQRGISHRPLNPDSEIHQKFIKNLELKKQQIQNTYPFMKF